MVEKITYGDTYGDLPLPGPGYPLVDAGNFYLVWND